MKNTAISLTTAMKTIGMLKSDSGWVAYALMDSNGWPVIQLIQEEHDREKYIDPTPDELWALQIRGWFREFQKVEAYKRHYNRKHNVAKKSQLIVREIPEHKPNLLDEVMTDLITDYPTLADGLQGMDDDDMYTLLYDALAKAALAVKKKRK